MHEAGEVAKQFNMSLRIEFLRTSTFVSTLPTILKMTRAAAHPNIVPMLDCYHFWSGLNKLEDLDMIRPGEIGHVHFQDVPDIPRELLDVSKRVIPGDGISPLTRSGTGRDAAREMILLGAERGGASRLWRD